MSPGPGSVPVHAKKNTRSELRVFSPRAQTIYTVSGVAPSAQDRRRVDLEVPFKAKDQGATGVVEARFDGGDITSDGGVLLTRSDTIARTLSDPRRQASCDHDVPGLVRQRLYAIALGYEDLNDHDGLRQDVALQTAVERDQWLASASTLCRFENRADRETAWRLHEVLLDQFIASFKRAPKKLILDFDATDDPVHGEQDGRFFHGYYRRYCFLPLYVFCGHQLLVSYLRPSNIDGAKHSWAILSLLVKRLRQVWPKVRIIFRGDGGFCRWKMLRWCDHHEVGYIIGLAKNKRLNRLTASLQDEAAACFAATGHKVRWFTDFQYAARSWDGARRVIAKIEHSQHGVNPRYVVTNLEGDAKQLYDKLYCARGDMENRIKENQLDMFGDRTSCQHWWPNQFRLLLASLAYTLIEAIRRIALKGTELANAYVGTIRLKLFKIGAVILKNTRRIRFLLASGCPYKELYFLAANRLAPG